MILVSVLIINRSLSVLLHSPVLIHVTLLMNMGALPIIVRLYTDIIVIYVQNLVNYGRWLGEYAQQGGSAPRIGRFFVEE